MNIFDVVIIGGGLAGSSAALHLSTKGYSVLVLEKTKFKKSIPCAGGMASSIKEFLPLNIDQAIESKIKNIHFTWKSKDNVFARLSGESPFVIVNRKSLESLLINQAKICGAKIINSISITELKKQDKNWIIKCRGIRNIESKYLVIADGSESYWSKYLNLGPKKPKYARTIAININGLGDVEKDSVRFDFGSIKYGFAWAFPMKDSVNIGIGTFIGNNLLADRALNDNIVKTFGFKNKNFQPIYKKLRIWNGFHNLHCEKALVIGDAASLCDPFLAEGIRPTLMSSYYASECIHKCLKNNSENLGEYTKTMTEKWSKSMVWGKRIAEVFYRFPKTGYRLGIKRKTAPERIAQILSGEMNYSDIAKRVIKRLIFKLR